MRSLRFVLVVAAILFVGATTSVAIDSKIAVPDFRPFTTEQNSASTKRLLRAQVASKENDDERAFPGLDKITAPLKASASKMAESVKLNIWLGKGKSASDVLAKLKLNEGVDRTLASPKLNILDNYVDMLNKKHPERQVSLLGTLTTSYDEVALAKAFVLAKRHEHSKDIATKLQTQQLEGWLNSQKSVDDVFNLLKIKDDGVLSMISRKLETMEEYIKLFNAKNPRHETNLFRALRNGFGEDQFALMVSRAMDNPYTSVAASKYQNELFKRWIKEDYDPMSVLIEVFKVDNRNLAAASAREKSIIAAYKPIYYRAKRLNQVGNVVAPRRS